MSSSEENDQVETQEEKESVKSTSPAQNELTSVAKLFETESDEDDDDEEEDDDEVTREKTKTSKQAEGSSQSDENESGDEGSTHGRRRLLDDDDESVDRSTSPTKKQKRAHKIVEDNEDDEDSQTTSKRKVINDDDDDDNDDPADKDDDDDSSSHDQEEDEDNGQEEDDKEEPEKVADDDEDEDDDDAGRKPSQHTVYDFDIMMAKKKEENSRRRKRKNYDIINDNDDIIAEMISQMRDAVELDREANKNKQAATKKLKMLPFVVNQLRKVDLRDAFLDSDILSAITEWLAPLPDKSLPHLNIRESLLKILQDFHLYDVDRIRGSGIGKAVMYLYKHPKETKENKIKAKELISSWSRPIFQLDSNFDAISREEREQRDLELMNKQNRVIKKPSGEQKKTNEERTKPGDKGWIPRARVPAPSMKDYVVRPASKVAEEAFRTRSRPSIVYKNKLPRRRYV